jgi:hypothetical protein
MVLVDGAAQVSNPLPCMIPLPSGTACAGEAVSSAAAANAPSDAALEEIRIACIVTYSFVVVLRGRSVGRAEVAPTLEYME